MIRSIIPNFFCRSNINLSLLQRFTSFVLVIIFSTTVFAEQHLQSDSTQSKMILKVGAEIYSSDETFNQKLLSDKVELRDIKISYINGKKAITLNNKHSVTSDKVIRMVKVEDTVSSRNLKKIITHQTPRPEVQRNEILRNKPFTNRYFFTSCTGRDWFNINTSNFKISKAAFLQKEFLTKCALNNLHCRLFVFYSSRALKNCFSRVYSVRPPPFI